MWNANNMQISKAKHTTSSSHEAVTTAYEERLRAIAYSMDTLIPGVYFWWKPVAMRLGGCEPEDQPYRYPGKIHSDFGFAIVLAGYRIFTTYKGTYDPGQASD
jgi:hypothetical protein